MTAVDEVADEEASAIVEEEEAEEVASATVAEALLVDVVAYRSVAVQVVQEVVPNSSLNLTDMLVSS